MALDTPIRFTDRLSGLMNSLSGAMGAADKTARRTHAFYEMSPLELQCAYRGNWLAKSVVDIPADDAMRKGWEWAADDAEIDRLKAEEARLDVRYKVLEAMRWARLYGGAAILVDDGAPDPGMPLNVDAVGPGGVIALVVMDRTELHSGPLGRDPFAPEYRMPEYYRVGAGDEKARNIHPTRIIRFEGAKIPGVRTSGDQHWGDSDLQAVNASVTRATAGAQDVSLLLAEAKVDVFLVPNLMKDVLKANYREQWLRRYDMANAAKSNTNALILDEKETYQQKQISFASLGDIMDRQLQEVSGASKIPATRFLGRSPAGMNSTGESDMRHHYERISADQHGRWMGPVTRTLDLVKRGAGLPDAEWKWCEVAEVEEAERSEIEKRDAEALSLYAVNNLAPPEVLDAMARKRLTEAGGRDIKDAYDEAGDYDLDIGPDDIQPAGFGEGGAAPAA